MNDEFRTSSPLLRSICAALAVLATVLVAGSMYGLIVHYNADAQVTSAQTVLIAQH